MSDPAYKKPGAKVKSDWRRSVHTGAPGSVYNYYADVEATFEHWVVSPTLELIDHDKGIYKARFTLYLGAYESTDFNIRGFAIAEQKLAEYLSSHGAKVIGSEVIGVFRHFRGSPV